MSPEKFDDIREGGLIRHKERFRIGNIVYYLFIWFENILSFYNISYYVQQFHIIHIKKKEETLIVWMFRIVFDLQ